MLASFAQTVFKIVYLWSVYLFFRPKLHYDNKQEQSNRVRGPAIVVSNHRGALDFLLLLLTFWRRTLRCIVSESIYNANPILKFFLWLFGAIKADRFGRKLDFMHDSLQVLERGGVVEIFPEARFHRPGETDLLPFVPSVVYLALKSGVPIIPVYHAKRESFWQRTRVAIGTPVYVSDILDSDNPTSGEMAEASEELRQRVINLREKYAKE